MSYTMTLDVPQKTADYVCRSPQLRKELNAIVVAVVTMRMQSAAARARRSSAQTGGSAVRSGRRLWAADVILDPDGLLEGLSCELDGNGGDTHAKVVGQ